MKNRKIKLHKINIIKYWKKEACPHMAVVVGKFKVVVYFNAKTVL